MMAVLFAGCAGAALLSGSPATAQKATAARQAGAVVHFNAQ